MQGEQAINRADDREDAVEGFANLQTEQEVKEFEAFLAQGQGTPCQDPHCTICEVEEEPQGFDTLPPGWENAPLSAQVAYLVAGDDPELFDAIKADLKGE